MYRLRVVCDGDGDVALIKGDARPVWSSGVRGREAGGEPEAVRMAGGGRTVVLEGPLGVGDGAEAALRESLGLGVGGGEGTSSDERSSEDVSSDEALMVSDPPLGCSGEERCDVSVVRRVEQLGRQGGVRAP